MHYRIEITPSLGFGRLELDRAFKAYKPRFLRGTLLDANEIPAPWLFRVEPNEGQELVMNDFYPEFHLMSERMLDALRGAGTSNLQVFAAEITNRTSGAVRKDFSVVNVVGLVSCADDARSESAPVADRKYYLRLVIDPSRAKNVPIFRLEESRSDLVVNEHIASAIRGASLRNIELEPVSAQ